ncbi:hypothetical protein ACHAXN_012384 [Cyclotella atomus]
MSDHPSPCSSPDSIPASADGSEATAPQVQRALDMYNSYKPRPAHSLIMGDTPPPPERKSRSIGSSSSDVNSPNKIPTNSPNRVHTKEGGRRYQFYAPSNATVDASGSPSNSKSNDHNTTERRGADPPEITAPITSGEEAAQKVRSRLIRLQNHHRDLRDKQYNLRRSTGNDYIVDTTDTAAKEMGGSERRSQSEILGDEYDGSPSSYLQFVEGNNKSSPREKKKVYTAPKSPEEHVIHDLFDDQEEDEEEEDDFPQVNMDPIESDDEGDNKYYGSAPSSPVNITDDYKNNCPSSAPLDSSNTRRGAQQSMMHRMSNKVMGGAFKPPFASEEIQQPQLFNSFQAQQQQQPSFNKSASMNKNQQREGTESLNDTIQYLRNLQIGANAPPSSSSPQHAVTRVHRPAPQKHSPQDSQDDDEHYALETYEGVGRSHRPLPRNSQQQQTVEHIKKGRFITAQEAMNYVMASSSRAAAAAGGGGGGSINQAANDINKAYSFLNNMTNQEILEYGLTGRGVGAAGGQVPQIMDSFDSDREEEEEEDDFERNTSLSMHAEEKFGSSKHAEDKLGPSMEQPRRRDASVGASDYDVDSSISISDRDGGKDVMHSFHGEKAPMRMADHHVSEMYRGRPRTGSNSLISPSVLEENTANQHVYAETVIPSQYEHEYNDQGSSGAHQSASFHGSRRGSGDYPVQPEYSFNNSAALGPRNKKPGGVTGVNLGEYANNKQQYHADEGYKSSDSFSEHSLRTDDPNSIAEEAEYSPSRDHQVNAQSTGLMTMLCGHLLPLGIDNSMQYDDTFCGMSSLFVQNSHQQKPTWNNDDPDEPGYIVHRLTNAELNSVEFAFEEMITAYGDSAAASNFERDLEQAEMILDAEEKRYKAEMKGALPSPGSDAVSNDSNGNVHHGSPSSRSYTTANSHHDDNEVRECVPDFPGIFPPGKGRPGELECFYLPIITKSQKTGFEPTKDLVLKPGTVFANNYLVQGELGSAAFSTAYRCIDLSSDEDEDGYQDEVCLKVIKNTKDYFDQSIDEIKILRLLKDTGKVQENNIVEMKSFFYHREHLVIVTELLRQNMYEFGKSIIESRGPAYFTRDRLSHITRQCLIALKFVHELGLMHCDIKPENILLRSYSRALVKVIDFGSSSFVSDRQSSYIQSRSYRAPEVILGLPYDGGIDMWSLGCVVAEMYTGEVTFQNDSEVSMLSRIEAICGPFPKHMIAKGRNSHRIFTDSGLIYEKVSRDEDDDDSHGGSVHSAEEHNQDKMRALFIDFVSKLLTIDPAVRLTAKEALKHPWILSSLELTEDEIRYPPSD